MIERAARTRPAPSPHVDEQQNGDAAASLRAFARGLPLASTVFGRVLTQRRRAASDGDLDNLAESRATLPRPQPAGVLTAQGRMTGWILCSCRSASVVMSNRQPGAHAGSCAILSASTCCRLRRTEGIGTSAIRKIGRGVMKMRRYPRSKSDGGGLLSVALLFGRSRRARCASDPERSGERESRGGDRTRGSQSCARTRRSARRAHRAALPGALNAASRSAAARRQRSRSRRNGGVHRCPREGGAACALVLMPGGGVAGADRRLRISHSGLC